MDPFIAEIRIFTFDFAPKNWAYCNGQVMPLQQNTALFSLLGTTYGGDGKATFGLPDLRARMPMHANPDGGNGLSLRQLGESGGVSTVTLTQNELPHHVHQAMALSGSGSESTPGPSVLLADTGGAAAYTGSTSAPQTLRATLGTAGNGLAHNNMPPYLALSFCICLQGEFPVSE
ncbi:tail fiber protein [Massilia sp. MB5]|uniref:phage tail protein n=1 Tax=unclassified Massilia TaxID=2609279 RepID=UPI00067D556B|nr:MULTISPECIES: tail fiber protein [unclassified Massilia]AKU23997.1 phage tail protein [Massilia sp. NR 4-1]UMR31045.1 tail fiber protein [Massilia sp. MB5]